jgi:hypothetical protein
MNETEFIKQLRATADLLKPLTCSSSTAWKVWDGTAYVKSDGKTRTLDPYALAWWTALRTIAELIEAQDSPVSSKQIAYLKSTLFGGMGSLNDLSFRNFDAINAQLRQKTSELFAAFND